MRFEAVFVDRMKDGRRLQIVCGPFEAEDEEDAAERAGRMLRWVYPKAEMVEFNEVRNGERVG